MDRQPGRTEAARGGLTLIEVLVVLFIILLISVVALPTVYTSLNHRQVSEAARILQGAIVGARDKAIHDGQPSGIRLLPDPSFPISWDAASSTIDPTQPLAYSRIIPIGPAPEYQEGAVSIYPAANYAAITNNVPYLVLEAAPTNAAGVPNAPTSWYWNVRVGDKIQINGAGPWYTVVGPAGMMPAGGNGEYFVNVGAPGAALPTLPSGNQAEFLLLTNGRDDDGNGLVDEGWDGVDNDGDGSVDEPSCPVGQLAVPPRAGEWETEAWQGAAAAGMVSVPYTIRRRPFPQPGAREISLPTQMVIDATTAFGTQERSRLPVNPYSGTVDLMVNPDGTVFYSSPYGTPSSVGMTGAFYHFFLVERQDVAPPDATMTAAPYLPLPANVAATAGITAPSQVLKGEFSILTLSGRTGQITTNRNPAFLYGATAGFSDQAGTSYNPSNPFIPAEQGVSSGP